MEEGLKIVSVALGLGSEESVCSLCSDETKHTQKKQGLEASVCLNYNPHFLDLSPGLPSPSSSFPHISTITLYKESSRFRLPIESPLYFIILSYERLAC